jgi:hypothetical protein
LPTAYYDSGIEASFFRSIVQNTTSPSFGRTRVFDTESQFTSLGAQQVTGNATTTNPVPPVRHPMLEKSLLTKIFEHLTTRSNVFAVYMTVGYFEVKDDTMKPELLGDEIGVLRDSTGLIVENKAIRHRMFAIIDRTSLTLQPPSWTAGTFSGEDVLKQGPAPYYYTSGITPLWPANLPTAGSPPTAVNGITLGTQYKGLWAIQLPITTLGAPVSNVAPLPGGVRPVVSASGTYNGISWVLNSADSPSATVLYVDTGDQQRRMVVRAIIPSPSTPGFAIVVLGMPPAAANPVWPPVFPLLASNPQATPTPPRPVLITNAIAGNPGPQPDFDHKQPNYRGVVLYSVILD